MIKRNMGADQAMDQREGAAAMEFVLIVPLLVMLFFGIIQFGLLMFRTQTIEAAAREGARVASVGATESEVQTAIYDAATGFLSATELEVSYDLCSSAGDDTEIEVVANADKDISRLNFDIPFVGTYSPTFSATATFRCERATEVES